jgi:mono/diheme cytochrome c family protein
MQSKKYRYHIVTLAFLTVVICLSQCATGEEEKSTMLLATNARPLRDVKFEATSQRIKRGEYLANGILMCMTCHSPRDTTKPGFPPIESKKGSGVILYDTEEERLVVPNITPDKETGAGSWTDDMLARAIREGVGHDGRALSLPMYWGSFRQLSDEDLASVVVYLRTIPLVKNKLPKRRFSAEREKELQGRSQPLLTPVAAPDLSDQVTRGRYYIKTADCIGCHTGWYGRNPGFFGGGNKLENYYGWARLGEKDTSYVFSTNITPHETGLKGWTPELFINVIRTGKSGLLAPRMPWVAYKNMTDEDLTAILSALQKLPPVNHKVVNGIKETHCEVCEMSHGYGEHNKIVPLKAVPFNKALYPDFVGTYTHPEEGFSYEVTLERGKLLISEGGTPVELVAVGENRFEALGFPTPVGFRRDEKGNVKGLFEYLMEDDLLVKQETPKMPK